MSKGGNAAWVAVWRRSENLSRTSGGCLAWIVRVRRRKRGKAGDPCHGRWALVEPRDNAVNIDRSGNRNVRQVGFRQPPIPCPAQPKRTHSLGEGPFDAGALPILRFAFCTGIPGPRVGHGLRLGARREPKPSAPAFGTGARGADWTWRTGLLGKFDNDGATPLATPMFPPLGRHLPLGTAHLLLLPVHHKLLHAVRALDLRLPGLTRTGGATENDVLLVAAADE